VLAEALRSPHFWLREPILWSSHSGGLGNFSHLIEFLEEVAVGERELEELEVPGRWRACPFEVTYLKCELTGFL
jgi:hypothetical protein